MAVGPLRAGARQLSWCGAVNRGIRREPQAPANSAIITIPAQRTLPGAPPRRLLFAASVRNRSRNMQAGLYTIMAAQFFSSLADNALLVAAIQLLRDLDSPAWMTPSLKQCFVVSYVLLAPLVGAFADSMPKGRVMLITNAIKIVGCGLMLF